MSRFGKTAVVVMVSVVLVLAGFVGWAAFTSHSDDTPSPNGPAVTEPTQMRITPEHCSPSLEGSTRYNPTVGRAPDWCHNGYWWKDS